MLHQCTIRIQSNSVHQSGPVFVDPYLEEGYKALPFLGVVLGASSDKTRFKLKATVTSFSQSNFNKNRVVLSSRGQLAPLHLGAFDVEEHGGL